MEKVCEHCGKAFTAKRATAKYDRPACRVAATRLRAQLRENAQPAPHQGAAPGSGGRALEPTAVWGPGESQAGPAWGDDEERPAEAQLVSVLSTTTDTLAAAEVLETPLGQAALVLAARLDNSHHEAGAALSSLAKQLDATLTRATAKAAKPAADPLEELRRKRQERRGA